MKTALSSVAKLWPGSTVVCLATGPSLTQSDVDFCRGKARVIAVNDAWTLAPWADALYSGDSNWWRWHQGVPSFGGLKYAIESQPVAWPGVHVLRDTGLKGLELNPTGLRTGLNSGYQAINLAVHLGAAKIVLLGYDMGHPVGRPSHFFGEHPHVYPNQQRFGPWIEKFATLVEPFRELGIEVVNCTPGSALKCFPTARLEDVFHVEQRRSA